MAGNRRKIERYQTKRKVGIKLPPAIKVVTAGAKVKRITIDHVDSFVKVKKVRAGGTLPETLSEKAFKKGVQAIIGEAGKFTDWGGEKSDLYTTRVKFNGKRVAAALAFKGPGLKGDLVPGRMGKNGDQIQRLFEEDAEVFFVQHWRGIRSSVSDQMRTFAIVKSLSTGDTIYYGVIDGFDSERLRRAYESKFK